MRPIRPCPACGGREARTLADLSYASFADSSLPAAFRLAACPTCGLAYYDATGLSEEGLAAYYRQRSGRAGATGGGGLSRWDLLHYTAIGERLRPWAGPERAATAADVGAGGGGLSSFLAEAGYQKLYAVEPGGRAAEARPGVSVLGGTAAALPLAPASMDLLIYSHVFEHLLQPGQALAEAARCLSPGGVIYLELPDASAYQAAEPYRQLYQEHLNHFDPHSLSELLIRNGFKPLALERDRLARPGGLDEGVIWAVAASGRSDVNPWPKNEGAEALSHYLADCAAQPLFRPRELSAEPAIVWGLSQQALFILERPPFRSLQITCFMDGDPAKQGRFLRGLKVLPPDDLPSRPEELLILSAFGAEEAMRAQALALGFRGRIMALRDL